jgi:trehalose 6-phosphate synthase
MDRTERKERWEQLIVTVRDDNVQRWTENFTSDLATVGRLVGGF